MLVFVVFDVVLYCGVIVISHCCTPHGFGLTPFPAFIPLLSFHFLIFYSNSLFPFFFFSFALPIFSFVHPFHFYLIVTTPFPGRRS